MSAPAVCPVCLRVGYEHDAWCPRAYWHEIDMMHRTGGRMYSFPGEILHDNMELARREAWDDQFSKTEPLAYIPANRLAEMTRNNRGSEWLTARFQPEKAFGFFKAKR